MLDVNEIDNFHFILTEKDEKNSKDIKFIEDLKKFSIQEETCFIIFDKKDLTLKIDIKEVKLKIPLQGFYSKVDVKINDWIKPEDIIKMLGYIPNYLSIRLEADNIDQIIKLMNCKILVEKLKEQGIKFIHKGIEIEPRIIEIKMNEMIKNKVTEIETKRNMLNTDYD